MRSCAEQAHVGISDVGEWRSRGWRGRGRLCLVRLEGGRVGETEIMGVACMAVSRSVHNGNHAPIESTLRLCIAS